MEEGDNWGNCLTHASMETTDVKPLMMMMMSPANIGGTVKEIGLRQQIQFHR